MTRTQHFLSFSPLNLLLLLFHQNVKIEKKIEKRGARVNRAQVKWGRRSINFDPDTV
jgi:hypothetical protein